MKSKLPSILLLGITACALLCSSCKGVITKDDAREIGAEIVKDSLVIASQAATGEKIDLKWTATQLSLKVANLAVQKATANLGVTASSEVVNAEAKRIVNAALFHAQGQIPEISPSPQETLTAQVIAIETADKTKALLENPDGGN